MSNPRIGTIKEDKSREWPQLNIEGAPYLRPVTTVKLDQTHFVVMPVNFETKWTLDAIRAEFPAFSPVEPLVIVEDGKPPEAATPGSTKKASDGKP